MELVAAGYMNKENATELNVTPQTVKNHMTSVLSKLDVSCRTHAVTTALRKSWILNPIQGHRTN